jgi:hypothetical protein
MDARFLSRFLFNIAINMKKIINVLFY